MISSPENNDTAMHDERLANQKYSFCDGRVISYIFAVSGYIIIYTCG